MFPLDRTGGRSPTGSSTSGVENTHDHDTAAPADHGPPYQRDHQFRRCIGALHRWRRHAMNTPGDRPSTYLARAMD